MRRARRFIGGARSTLGRRCLTSVVAGPRWTSPRLAWNARIDSRCSRKSCARCVERSSRTGRSRLPTRPTTATALQRSFSSREPRRASWASRFWPGCAVGARPHKRPSTSPPRRRLRSPRRLPMRACPSAASISSRSTKVNGGHTGRGAELGCASAPTLWPLRLGAVPCPRYGAPPPPSVQRRRPRQHQAARSGSGQSECPRRRRRTRPPAWMVRRPLAERPREFRPAHPRWAPL